MSPELIALLVDKGISLLAGLIITLFGFRIIGKKKGESATYDARMDKYGIYLKICGPLILLINLILLLMSLSISRH